MLNNLDSNKCHKFLFFSLEEQHQAVLLRISIDGQPERGSQQNSIFETGVPLTG